MLKNRGILLKPDPTHVDYKSMERLRRLLEAEGFVLEKAYYAESHLPGLREIERTLMGAVPLLRRRIALPRAEGLKFGEAQMGREPLGL